MESCHYHQQYLLQIVNVDSDRLTVHHGHKVIASTGNSVDALLAPEVAFKVYYLHQL